MLKALRLATLRMTVETLVTVEICLFCYLGLNNGVFSAYQHDASGVAHGEYGPHMILYSMFLKLTIGGRDLGLSKALLGLPIVISKPSLYFHL